jgi:hypothetical protein
MDPSYNNEPTVYAAKQAIIKEHTNGTLKMYMDFHAHRAKRGCFIYGSKPKDIDSFTQT